MNANNDLAQLLKAHKHEMRVGDKRLADMANTYAGIPLVNRSSIRNWSDGSAKGVRDCRALVAIAGALRLTKSDADTLLAAGECPDLAAVFAANRDHQELFSWWDLDELDSGESAGADITGEEPDSDGFDSDRSDRDRSDRDGSGRDAQGQTDSDGVKGHGSEGEESDRDGGEGRGLEGEESDQGERGPQPRTDDAPGAIGSQRQLIAGLALVVVVAIGAYWWFGGRGQSEGDPTTDPDAPPVSAILAPAHEAVVGEAFTASGTAAHPAGVSHVEAVLVDMDRNTYWNPRDEVWQQKWQVFSIPVSGDDLTEARWEVKLGDSLPLLPGKYRLRVWARSLTNRGDPIGPLVEFDVNENLNPRDEDAFERSVEIQNNPVPDPAFELEASGEVPKSRSEYPWNGSSVFDGFRLLSNAEYEPGLESMTVELQDVISGDYWNFEAQRWQTSPTGLVVAADDADCGACTELKYDMWMPAGSTPPGEYVVTTRAVGADGATNPDGTTSEFTVIGP